jgi:uncharacterized protein (DUF934 family)
MVVITDTGFGADNWQGLAPVGPDDDSFTRLSDDELAAVVIRLDSDADMAPLVSRLAVIGKIVINFPASSDGRGFSLARQLRLYGYQGRLRASGALIPDQYRHARQCGFDEVAVNDGQARRQPLCHWTEQLPRLRPGYQARLFESQVLPPS